MYDQEIGMPTGDEAPPPPVETKTKDVVPLPKTRKELEALRKIKRPHNLNEEVDQLFVTLWEESEPFRSYLDAVHSEQSIEGSLFLDDSEAARIVREFAADSGRDYVARQKLATLIKALHVVMKRYGLGRQERRAA